MITELLNALKNESGLLQVLMGDVLSEETMKDLEKNYKCLKDFFETPIGDPSEAKLKKSLAAAVIIAKEKGIIPSEVLDTCSPEQIATIVDTGLSQTKVAYKVAKGELSSIEATDYLIDKEASRLDALVDVAFDSGLVEKGIKAAAAAVCAWLGCNPESVVLVVSSVYKRMEPTLRKVTHKGVKIMADAAKEVAPVVVEGVRKIKTAIMEKLVKYTL